MKVINGATYDPERAIKAQKKYCEEHKLPHFAPFDGICFRCRQNIYERVERGERVTGISVEGAGSQLITGCPHCNRTYCD